MIDGMTVRDIAPSMQRWYLATVKNFTAFLGCCLDRADAKAMRHCPLYMRSSGASASSMNAVVSAVRFFLSATLERGDANVGMTTVYEPRGLPVVLSPRDVVDLLEAAPVFKYWAALSGACMAQPSDTHSLSKPKYRA